MAKHQYRITTEGNWTSNYGFAFLVLFNASGSNRKITLRSMDVFVSSAQNSDAAKTGCSTATLYRCEAPVTGDDMNASAAKLDSAASVPSTVVVRRGALANAFTDRLRRVDVCRRSGAVGTQNMHYSNSQFSRINGNLYRSAMKDSSAVIEPVFVRQNEAIVLVSDATCHNTYPTRVNVTISIDGKTVNWNFIAVPRPGIGLFSIENTGASVVKVLHFAVSELGTTDTAFIRMVPVGQMYAPDIADACKMNISATPMDSAYPALTALKAYGDIGFIPSGSPEVAISEGSTGTPKGMNYLHTRDFNGPCFRTFLPEMLHAKSAGSGTPDMWGLSYGFNWSDMLTRKAGIVINPGEGVALVSSAETAVGVQAAYSGWPAITFQAIVDEEPLLVPVITIYAKDEAGAPVANARVAVYKASDSSELLNTLSDSNGRVQMTYSDYVSDTDIMVRIRKSSAGDVRYFPLTASGTIVLSGFASTYTLIADKIAA